MKTKLLRKLRKRALRRVRYEVHANYVMLAEREPFTRRNMGRFGNYTIPDFWNFSMKGLDKKLRFARMECILSMLKEFKDKRQIKLLKQKAKQLNRMR